MPMGHITITLSLLALLCACVVLTDATSADHRTKRNDPFSDTDIPSSLSEDGDVDTVTMQEERDMSNRRAKLMWLLAKLHSTQNRVPFQRPLMSVPWFRSQERDSNLDPYNNGMLSSKLRLAKKAAFWRPMGGLPIETRLSSYNEQFGGTGNVGDQGPTLFRYGK